MSAKQERTDEFGLLIDGFFRELTEILAQHEKRYRGAAPYHQLSPEDYRKVSEMMVRIMGNVWRKDGDGSFTLQIMSQLISGFDGLIRCASICARDGRPRPDQ